MDDLCKQMKLKAKCSGSALESEVRQTYLPSIVDYAHSVIRPYQLPCEDLVKALAAAKAQKAQKKQQLLQQNSSFSTDSLMNIPSLFTHPQHRDSESSLTSNSSLGVPTPVSPMNASQQTTLNGLPSSWMNDVMMGSGLNGGESEFLSFLGTGPTVASGANASGFSPGAYLNLPDKE